MKLEQLQSIIQKNIDADVEESKEVVMKAIEDVLWESLEDPWDAEVSAATEALTNLFQKMLRMSKT